METSTAPTGFGAHSTAGDVLRGVDLSGRTAVVTGGYSGVGLATTVALARAGARVVVPARRPDTARAALAGLSTVEVASLDLADLDSVRAFADGYLAGGRPVHLLVANAAVMACPETRVGPGREAQFAVNHLGHFALVQALWPALVAAGGARVVAVATGGGPGSRIFWDDVQFERGYDKWRAYVQSKTAAVLFAARLDVLGRASGVRAFSATPGYILTPLQRHLTRQEMVDAGWVDADGTLVAEGFKTPEQGAATQVWAGTAAALDGLGGRYCEDCALMEPVVDPATGDVLRGYRVDPGEATRLWTLSARLTGFDAIPAG